MTNPADLRTEYQKAGLRRSELRADPIEQFSEWFETAISEKVPEPTAMALATADASGYPSCRIVLLKGFDEKGLRFFTNYGGRKGRELAENPRACVTFHWQSLERQVVVAGRVEKLGRKESEEYFHSRPQKSQLGAATSPQSEAIPSRAFLEERMAKLEREYGDKKIPLPDFWGGYLLVPERFEFWQGRRSRLHDRFQYSRDSSTVWKIERLSP